LTTMTLILFFLSCNTRSGKDMMTVKEFTKIYFDSLTHRFPTTKFSIVDDSTIQSSFQDYDMRISSDNAYREYKMEPDSLYEVLSRYVTVSSEAIKPTKELDINNIVPIIKPVEYLEELQIEADKLGAKKDIEGVYERYNDQLIIAYAHDSKNNIQYLTRDDLKSLSINSDSLRPIAIRNLDKILNNIERQGTQGTYMLTAGGNFEVSIILLDNIFTKKSLPVEGEYVIAIPNRDMLLVTGSRNKAGIEKIKGIAKESFETGNYQVSQYLYKWNGKRFEKYE